MAGLEHDLSTYYDQEASDRALRPLGSHRLERRRAFIELVRSEGRASVLEIGVGPGHDAAAFAESGVAPVGVDLSIEHTRLARANGVVSMRASVLALPFPAHSFDSGWTMSTLVHVSDADFGQAMAELIRVLRPGAPLAIGLWGGFDGEGTSGFDHIDPPRFFSHRSHERARAMLARQGEIEQFDTWPDDRSSWEYQFVVLRVGAR